MRNLGVNVKQTEALDYASGSADRNGATLDMAGFGGVLVQVHFAAIATGAVTKIKVQQGKLANGSDMADLEGTGITIADDADNKLFWLDLRPSERYVRLVVDKDATNATAESAVYVQYDPQGIARPFTDADGETHGLPAEGTA